MDGIVIRAAMRTAPMALLFALGVAQPAGAGESAASLAITITGAISAKGVIRIALCAPDTGFPDCRTRVVRTASLAIAQGSARAVFAGLPPGSYAISAFHDANGNGRLDTFAGIPREGYGFSRNPPFRPRAPHFEEARIEVHGATTATISLRYIL